MPTCHRAFASPPEQEEQIMGLIAFPFIMCLLASPFVFAGIFVYMWWKKREAKRIDELFERRHKAEAWLRDQLGANSKEYVPLVSNERYQELKEEAEKKFGVTLL